MSRHARKQKKGEFCAVASTPCTCGNDYIEVCKPSWGDASRFHYRASRRRAAKKVYEAHHLLCVASVGKIIVGNQAIDTIVAATKWCVNKSDNMLAMPLWGHTVRWYCKDGKRLDFRAGVAAPPFADIPQHDWDHTGDGGYIEELEPKLEAIAQAAERAKKKHEVATANLASDLDSLAKSFRSALQARGVRSGGTDSGWRQGRDSLGSNAPSRAPKVSRAGVLGGRWYYPFSMASDGGVTAKGYPDLDFDDTAREKLEWLAKRLKGLGGA